MASWEEVKRLAADFQKIQLSSSTQKLSERNCIEIVLWLMNRKLINLIFTSDGRECITPAELVQAIKGELYVNGGRVNFVELSNAIGVDMNHITTSANEILKSSKDVQLVLGQLIDGTYITKIAGEINEKLSQQGQINISELTIQYDLPAEFLQKVFEKQLGKTIFGKADKNNPKIFYTEAFIARTKAKIKGCLAGLTRPTPVSVLLTNLGIADKLFFSLYDQSSSYGFLTSHLPGAVYMPNIYCKTQNMWASSFYKQNNYLDFDALGRIGISDCRSFIKKLLPDEDVIFLSSCVISRRIAEQLEADIEECISSKTCLDLQSTLPSMFSDEDITLITNHVLSPAKQKHVLVLNNCILSKQFMDDLATRCESTVQENAKLIVDSGKFQQYQTDLAVGSSRSTRGETVIEETKVDKREERRRKAAGGKSGGGTQGRETKTKSTKKGGRAHKSIEDDDEDHETATKKPTLEIISVASIRDIINSALEEEGLDHLVDAVAEYLHPILNENGLSIAASLYASTVTDRTANRKQTHNEIQNKINLILGDIRLFEKGLKLLPAEVQVQLHKYLLKTLCTDILNELLNYVASEEGFNLLADGLNNEQRSKFINDLPASYKTSLLQLSKSLTGQNVEDFLAAAENALSSCSMIVKKIDKKKDRSVILTHKHNLIEQLDKCEDPALVLHLAALIIFISATQQMIHASGRHVAVILTFLNQFLSAEQMSELHSYHDFVTLMLSGGSEAENAKEKLKEKIPTIRELASEFKKSTTAEKNA